MVLSLFDYSNKIRDAFIAQRIECVSVDILPGHQSSPVNIVTDILNFNYKSFDIDSVKFLHIALPCDCYSIASGSFHFKKGVPVTLAAHNAIRILIKIYQITKYFDCSYLIENPTGGLINNPFFKSFFNLNVTRLTLANFGYPTRKQTDLFYNFDMLLLVPVTYRVNGKYQVYKLDNMSYRKRVDYPTHYVNWIVENIIKNVNF